MDTWLLLLIMILTGLGSVILYSASFASAEVYLKDPYHHINAHLRNLALGLALMLVLSQIPYQVWLRLSPWVALLSLAGLLAVLNEDLSRKVLGSGRWLKYVPFQPSEAAKLAAVVWLADYFARIGDRKRHLMYGLVVPCMVIVIFGVLIVAERDLGGALVVMGVVICLMISAGVRAWHFALLTPLSLPIYVLVKSFSHRVGRFIGWENPWLLARDEGYSIIHSFYAFAGGGLTGTGIGQGQQKMFFLPMAYTDYIFSILGEELGLLGVATVSLLFLLLASRGFSIALAAKSRGGYLLAVGATLIIIIPAIINMMVALSIVPAKGLPLPFFSYGGSSVVVSLAAMGLLLNVAGQTLKAERPPLVVKPYGVQAHAGQAI
jgi:cell division protein FtsW